MLSIYQFIGFSPLNKSAGKATEVNTAIRRLVGRTSILRKVKALIAGEKRKASESRRHRRRLLGNKKP